MAFEKTDDNILVKTVIGKQKSGNILIESTDEKITPVGEIDVDITTIHARYTVTRNGKRDLNETEKDFPCEKVVRAYSVDGSVTVEYVKYF